MKTTTETVFPKPMPLALPPVRLSLFTYILDILPPPDCGEYPRHMPTGLFQKALDAIREAEAYTDSMQWWQRHSFKDWQERCAHFGDYRVTHAREPETEIEASYRIYAERATEWMRAIDRGRKHKAEIDKIRRKYRAPRTVACAA